MPKIVLIHVPHGGEIALVKIKEKLRKMGAFYLYQEMDENESWPVIKSVIKARKNEIPPIMYFIICSYTSPISRVTSWRDSVSLTSEFPEISHVELIEYDDFLGRENKIDPTSEDKDVKIANLEKTVKELKESVHCLACGTLIPNIASYCPECGALKKVVKKKMKFTWDDHLYLPVVFLIVGIGIAIANVFTNVNLVFLVISISASLAIVISSIFMIIAILVTTCIDIVPVTIDKSEILRKRCEELAHQLDRSKKDISGLLKDKERMIDRANYKRINELYGIRISKIVETENSGEKPCIYCVISDVNDKTLKFRVKKDFKPEECIFMFDGDVTDK